MDINLGKFKLTNNQQAKLCESVKGSFDGSVKGCSYWNDSGEIILVCSRELTKEELHEIEVEINAIPDTAPTVKVDEKLEAIKNAKNLEELKLAVINYVEIKQNG